MVVTDARHYSDLSRNVFRFLPLRLNVARSRAHARHHERIGIREYEAAIRTYRQLVVEGCQQLKNGDGAVLVERVG